MPDPGGEESRIEALYNLNILHSQSEERFERITRVAKNLFNTDYAGISIVDRDKVWFKSFHGVNDLDFEEIDRKESISDKVISKKDVFIVKDISQDPVLVQTFMAKKLGIRFFAGIPLKSPDGYFIGAFFVSDKKAREFTSNEQKLLKDLTAWVMEEILRGKTYLDEQKMRSALVSRNQELARQKARSDAMLADIGDGVIGINDKGEIIFINDAVEALTGYKRSELLGKLLIQAIKMQTQKGLNVEAANLPIRQAIFYRKKVQSRQYLYVKKDGTKFPADITATPVVVFNQIIGGIVVFRDITREIEVDRMKTEFISLASHQLRTPLSAVKWFCEILVEGDAGTLTDEQKEMLTNIYKSNERMIELVNTLLNISRIESGRIMIDPKETDLKKLLDDIILEVTPKLRSKKQNIAVSVHDKLPEVFLDPKLIRHVYMNLLTNAIKYSKEEGDIVVVISKKDNEIISQVSDHGYGIPKAQHEKVFGKFFRAENIIKIETEGTGLGLYLAKAIVESSGGKIWFASEEGKGTTFWFSLPLKGVKKDGEVSIDS